MVVYANQQASLFCDRFNKIFPQFALPDSQSDLPLHIAEVSESGHHITFLMRTRNNPLLGAATVFFAGFIQSLTQQLRKIKQNVYIHSAVCSGNLLVIKHLLLLDADDNNSSPFSTPQLQGEPIEYAKLSSKISERLSLHEAILVTSSIANSAFAIKTKLIDHHKRAAQTPPSIATTENNNNDASIIFSHDFLKAMSVILFSQLSQSSSHISKTPGFEVTSGILPWTEPHIPQKTSFSGESYETTDYFASPIDHCEGLSTVILTLSLASLPLDIDNCIEVVKHIVKNTLAHLATTLSDLAFRCENAEYDCFDCPGLVKLHFKCKAKSDLERRTALFVRCLYTNPNIPTIRLIHAVTDFSAFFHIKQHESEITQRYKGIATSQQYSTERSSTSQSSFISNNYQSGQLTNAQNNWYSGDLQYKVMQYQSTTDNQQQYNSLEVAQKPQPRGFSYSSDDLLVLTVKVLQRQLPMKLFRVGSSSPSSSGFPNEMIQLQVSAAVKEELQILRVLLRCSPEQIPFQGTNNVMHRSLSSGKKDALWRPSSVFEPLRDALLQLIKEATDSKAYLLRGSTGSGKSTLLQLFTNDIEGESFFSDENCAVFTRSMKEINYFNIAAAQSAVDSSRRSGQKKLTSNGFASLIIEQSEYVISQVLPEWKEEVNARISQSGNDLPASDIRMMKFEVEFRKKSVVSLLTRFQRQVAAQEAEEEDEIDYECDASLAVEMAVDYFARFAGKRIILLIDDIQYFDELSWRILANLITSSQSIFLVATVRELRREDLVGSEEEEEEEFVSRANDNLEENVKGLFNSVVEIDSGEFSLSLQDKQTIVSENILRLLGGSGQEAIVVEQRQLDLVMRICERIQADRTPKDLVNAAFAFAARGLVDTKKIDQIRRLIVSKELSDVADNELVEYLHYADGDVRSHGICDVSVLINAVTGGSLQIMILLAVAGQQFDMRFITAVLASRLGVVEQVVEVVKQLCAEGALEVLVEGSLEFKWSGGGGQRLFGLKEKLLRCVSSRFVGETRKLLIEEVSVLFQGKMKHGEAMYVKAVMGQRFASVLARRHARRMKADNQKSEFLAGEVEASKAVAELAGRVARKATVTGSGDSSKTIYIGEEATDLHGDCLFEVTVLVKQKKKRLQCKVHICIDEIVLSIVQSPQQPRMKVKGDENFVSVLEQFPYLDESGVEEIASNFQDIETGEIWVMKRTQLRRVTLIESGKTHERLALLADFARVYSNGGGVDGQQLVSELSENVSFELEFSEEKQGVAVLELIKCWEVPCELIVGDDDSGEEETKTPQVEKGDIVKSDKESSAQDKQTNQQANDAAVYYSQQQGDDEDMSEVQEEIPSNIPAAAEAVVAVDYSLLETGTFLSDEQLQMTVTDRGRGVDEESSDIHRHLLADLALSDHVELVLPNTNRGTSTTFGTLEEIRESRRPVQEVVKKLLLPPQSFEGYNGYGTRESNQSQEEEYETTQIAVEKDNTEMIRSEQMAGYLKKDVMEKEAVQRDQLEKKYEEVDRLPIKVLSEEVAQNDSKNQMEEHQGEVEDVPDFSELDYNSGNQVQSSLEEKVISQIEQPRQISTTNLLHLQDEDYHPQRQSAVKVEVRNEKKQVEVRQLQKSAEVDSVQLKLQMDDERRQHRVQQELLQQKLQEMQQEKQQIYLQLEQQKQYHQEQKQKQEREQQQQLLQQAQQQLQEQKQQLLQQAQQQHQEQQQRQQQQQLQQQLQQQQQQQYQQQQLQQQQQQQEKQQKQQQQHHQQELHQKQQVAVDKQSNVQLQEQQQQPIINQHFRQESESVEKKAESTITIEKIAQPLVIIDPVFASYNSSVISSVNEIKKQVIVEEVSSSYLTSLMSRFLHDVPVDQQPNRQDNNVQIEGRFSRDNRQPSLNQTASEVVVEEGQVESSEGSQSISVTTVRESFYDESVIEEDEKQVQGEESQVISANKIVTPLSNNSYLREPAKNAVAKRMEEQFAKRRDELRKIQLQRNPATLQQQNFHSPVKEFPLKEVVATTTRQFLKSPSSTPSSAYSTTKRFQEISSDIPLISSVVRTACRSMRGDIFEVIPGDSVQLRLSLDPDEPSCEVIFNRKIGWFPSKRFFQLSDQNEPPLPRSHAPTQPAFTYKFPERKK